jgi:hypothetical protein
MKKISETQKGATAVAPRKVENRFSQRMTTGSREQKNKRIIVLMLVRVQPLTTRRLLFAVFFVGRSHTGDDGAARHDKRSCKSVEVGVMCVCGARLSVCDV